MAEIKLIHANSTTRVLSDQEKVQQSARLAVLFQQLKASGTKIKGRKREFVAGMLGVSTAQVGRMESVDRNLVPDAKEEFQQGGMNFSTAYETSLLPAEQQQQVVDDLRQGEKVDIKAVKQRRQPATKTTTPPAKPEPPPDIPAFTPGASAPPSAKPAPRTHKLKTWPEPFDAIVAGLKPWEFRKNDRDYHVGDILHLMRYDPEAQEYTGQTLDMTVTYIMPGNMYGIPAGYVVMSLGASEVMRHE